MTCAITRPATAVAQVMGYRQAGTAILEEAFLFVPQNMGIVLYPSLGYMDVSQKGPPKSTYLWGTNVPQNWGSQSTYSWGRYFVGKGPYPDPTKYLPRG